jgi:4-phosphopantoate--beta-alanine ligase
LRTDIPVNHPRFISLQTRAQLVEGFQNGLVSSEGLIAHGRGEAFDYLLGEETSDYSVSAIEAACCCLLAANHPVISVNGNFAALCSTEIVRLSNLIPARIEINLFHRSAEREHLINQELERKGAKNCLGSFSSKSNIIPGLSSNRRIVHSDGIYNADVIMVSLEDGDRTQALVEMGKKVIALDLNPISRTAQTANITIVDNVIRAMPLMIRTINMIKLEKNSEYMQGIICRFDNKRNLANSFKLMLLGLERQSIPE